VVAVIPTKEMAFSKYLEHQPTLPLSDVLDKLIANERIARQKMFAFFDEAHIAYVDTLPGLQQSVGHELYARLATDMHPGKNGYRVIGEEIAAALQERNAALQERK
jgi:lysophospholipase L1-like esterase